ncbi:hypothetical protein [Microbacterium sp. 1.5R]|uniref:hypothetical protein n=1 Tax=Microbacterium sp. 1.5R TaxID=1916917 RepID=UPI0011AAF355|nr:hypothetical protein [Microbacterium sp. 1.5R]
MKKLPALAALAAGILLLSGCSEQVSKYTACGSITSQAVQVTGAIGALTSPTPEAARAALDEVRGVVENIRLVDGPDEFVTLREAWTTSIDAVVAEGENALAGNPGNMDAVTSDLRTTTEAIVGYCAP